MIFKAGDELVLKVLHAFWFFKAMPVCRGEKKQKHTECELNSTGAGKSLCTTKIIFTVKPQCSSERVSRVCAATPEQFQCFKCKPLLCLSLVCCHIYDSFSALYMSLCYILSYTCCVNPACVTALHCPHKWNQIPCANCCLIYIKVSLGPI